jgi:hypothetical protein
VLPEIKQGARFLEIPIKVQVAIFLKDFKKVATEGGGLYVINREKNRDALISLGLTQNNRKEALLSLTVSDYCAGPKKDRDRDGFIWEFGQTIDGNEIYIKLKVAEVGETKISKCISFHKAEFKLCYPLR